MSHKSSGTGCSLTGDNKTLIHDTLYMHITEYNSIHRVSINVTKTSQCSYFNCLSFERKKWRLRERNDRVFQLEFEKFYATGKGCT